MTDDAKRYPKKILVAGRTRDAGDPALILTLPELLKKEEKTGDVVTNTSQSGKGNIQIGTK
jgi:hypothetical protein